MERRDIREMHERWAASWPIDPTMAIGDYVGRSTGFTDVVALASESLKNVEFLIQRLEADPEYNFPIALVWERTTMLDPAGAIAYVRMYRLDHPFPPPDPPIPRLLPELGHRAIALCGRLGSGKTTAGNLMLEELGQRHAIVRLWSFGTNLKRFCGAYLEGMHGDARDEAGRPMLFGGHGRAKRALPRCAETWVCEGRVRLGPSHTILEHLRHVRRLAHPSDPGLPDRIQERLQIMFARHLHELDGRKIMQIVGSAIRDLCGPDFWVRSLAEDMRSEMSDVRAFEGTSNVVHIFDDVRFQNEADWLRANGALLIRIDRRPSDDDVRFSRDEISPHTPDMPLPTLHVSELSADDVCCDAVVQNCDGDRMKLRRDVSAIVESIFK
jgi:hypothetical protein